MIFRSGPVIELEHSPLGGSAAHRFMNCEGSFLEQRRQIEAGQFENVESEYAKLGTAAHELGAKAIATGMEPYEFLGEEFNGYLAGWPGGVSLDAVQVYFSECMGILARRKELGHMLLEDTIHLPKIHPLFKGTVDFGFWSMSDGVFLRDYKNGEGIGVSAPGNKQLLYYGALMIFNIGQTALDNTVHHRLVGGGEIPSAKLVEKIVRRVWKPGAAAALKAAFGDAAFTSPEIKSPAQVEKLSSQGKALALEYGYKPESHGLSVAPMSDPRPQAKPKSNADVFKGHAQSLDEAGF
jgi:hypothetical protein